MEKFFRLIATNPLAIGIFVFTVAFTSGMISAAFRLPHAHIERVLPISLGLSLFMVALVFLPRRTRLRK